MTWLNRVIRKPSAFFLWLFTGLVVTNTLVMIFTLGPVEKDTPDKDKTVKPPKKERERSKEAKPSRRELFDFLSEHGVYPDLETPEDDLITLVENIH